MDFLLIKKAECWGIDAFELWCWGRRLRVPWTTRRSDQSLLKEICPDYSLEGLMLKLKLQYFGNLMRRADSFKKPGCWEGLRAGGEGDNRGWDGWMASLTWWTWVWVSSRSWWWTGRPGVLQSMGLQRVRQDWVTELNWTQLKVTSANTWLTLFSVLYRINSSWLLITTACCCLVVKLCPSLCNPWTTGLITCYYSPHWASQVALEVNNLPANAGDVGSILGLERSPGEGNGNSSIVAWRIPWTVHRVPKSWTQLK